MRWVALPLLTLAACRGGGGDGADRILSRSVSAELGAEVAVTCPAGRFPKTCAVTVPGGSTLELDVTETRDAYRWALRGFVIATAPLVAAIRAELDDLGIAAGVDCGPALRPAAVGDRVRCVLAIGATTGAAWAKILDDEGGFDLELALTPAAVAAREGEVDEAALVEASRALDRDEAEGVDDDGLDVADAGVARADAGALGSPR